MQSQFVGKKGGRWVAGFLLLGMAAIGFGPGAFAQDEKTPLQAGRYNFSTAGSFGFRWLNLEGNSAKYNQLLNLQEGFRVFDGQLNFLSREPGEGWFDDLSITTQNLGGDPFPAINVIMRKNGHAEVRLGYRATQYFYDLPQTSLTPNRSWIDRRRLGDADVRYTPTRNLRFRFFYNRTERDGNDLSSGPFFYLPLAPGAVSAFGRANALPWAIPLEEKANLYGGNIDWQVWGTNIHLEQSYRTYNNPANLGGLAGQPLQLLGPGSPANNLQVQ
ncbi:MAG: hypothetical protein HY647_07965, partial [Acidobacteria bacterium]|nr:hypothetical protein [Acidobacteriota bacterium]